MDLGGIILMAEIKFEYQSVKDVLPVDDGMFYDVMVILYGTSIEGGYNYYRGTYQNGFFFVDGGMYDKEKDFICSWPPALTRRSILRTPSMSSNATRVWRSPGGIPISSCLSSGAMRSPTPLFARPCYAR